MRGLVNGNIKQLVETAIPLHKFLAVKLLEQREGYAMIKIPFREEVIGDFHSRHWHSGILATVMGSVGGIAGISYLKFCGNKIATIDLQVDYLRGAKAEAIIVEGKVLSFIDNILITSLHAWQGEKVKLIAEGKGVYGITKDQAREK